MADVTDGGIQRTNGPSQITSHITIWNTCRFNRSFCAGKCGVMFPHTNAVTAGESAKGMK
ncbi:MAG: hypothetical protein DRQ37_03150 [Gammaproteobacteria bacterium]|nr:MAG: hypothetical protein DRQ37_03150 [Gammaproteobacteria bacterium]